MIEDKENHTHIINFSCGSELKINNSFLKVCLDAIKNDITFIIHTHESRTTVVNMNNVTVIVSITEKN